MANVAEVQRKVSLPVISSCKECYWIEPCGGYHDREGLFWNTCFEKHCCGGKAECNYLCPANSRYIQMLNEVEGLRFNDLLALDQRKLALPEYIPSVLHHSLHAEPLNIPFVAIPPKEVLRIRSGHMEPVASNATDLRHRLLLSPQTKIALNCIQQDNEIEKLWEYWVQDDIPCQLATLGIDAVIAPNFSHLRGVPRTEILGNRMRHLMCARDMDAAGLNVIPHLSVVDPQDWDFWREWLKRNPEVKRVAFEFQTGYKIRMDGLDAIGRLACVQQAINRELHVIAVGGTQYRDEIRSLFNASTFIDATPFSKTVRRQRGRISAGQLAWSPWETEDGEMLDELFANNFRVYTAWMSN